MRMLAIGRELWVSSFGVRTTKCILLLADANQGAARGLLGKARGCREKGWGTGMRQGAREWVSQPTGSQEEQEPRKPQSRTLPTLSPAGENGLERASKQVLGEGGWREEVVM